MGLEFRTAHGNGANGVARVEPTADGLPPGVQAPEQVEARDERRTNGTFAEGASTPQSKGGKALKERTRLGHQAGLPPELVKDPEFAAFAARETRGWSKAERRRLAQLLGGGELGPGPALAVRIAALQAAASLFSFAKGDLGPGSKYGNDAVQTICKCHVLAAAEGKARVARDPGAVHVAAMEALAAAAGEDARPDARGGQNNQARLRGEEDSAPDTRSEFSPDPTDDSPLVTASGDPPR